ncbi:MAG: hypothetical protein HKP48_11025 [Winogradskyella sp.]|uniref:hypothetical protein n=1 Tax=Winogradskyella sp. TaxID=1883156 RepID=UPI0017CD803D|nr:hypothetical protein [Winogradskyella sp.]MBT8244128.1 hypothetical protein [Winogradskyella sp.]NNK23793.1 hypothetical protein [Winogradskyella sp.]
MNLIIETSSTLTANATTTPISNCNSNSCTITIKFKESYIETATDLSIARTAIHESLHAILAYMYEQGLLESQDGTPLEGYEELVDSYTLYLMGETQFLGLSQHELMIDFIRFQV